MTSTMLINFHLTGRKYKKCIDEKGDKIDECYKVHYVAFKNCYDKLLILVF